MRVFLTLNAFALFLAPAALAQSKPDIPAISAEDVRATVTFLADDRLEGRDAGTPGYDLAADYLAKRFADLGLKPGGPDGSWYQKVPLIRYALDPAKRGSVTIGDKILEHGQGALLSASARNDGTERVSGDAVFVGYGRDSDYAGLDVRGKVVIALLGWPKGGPGKDESPNKQKTAAAHGAVAMLRLITPENLASTFSWIDMTRSYSRPRTGVQDPVGTPDGEQADVRIGGFLSPGTAVDVFAGAPTTARQVFAAAAKQAPLKGFYLKTSIALERSSIITPTPSPNVIGLLPGSDPALAGEFVLLSAHLDHLGKDMSRTGDQVYNGAIDNAVGVAMMIEAARAFQQSGARPRRSILFAALTAEEDGLLGSDYLARNPPVGTGKLVAVVNLDMPVLLYDFRDVIAFGAEHSTLGPIVEAAAAKLNIGLSPDPMPDWQLFTRSDHYSFVKQGVPSIFLVTGFADGGETAFKDFMKKHYHRVSDEVSLPINWQAGAKFAQINYLIARDIADGAEAPRWYERNAFGDLYARGAPKAKPRAPVKRQK